MTPTKTKVKTIKSFFTHFLHSKCPFQLYQKVPLNSNKLLFILNLKPAIRTKTNKQTNKRSPPSPASPPIFHSLPISIIFLSIIIIITINFRWLVGFPSAERLYPSSPFTIPYFKNFILFILIHNNNIYISLCITNIIYLNIF